MVTNNSGTAKNNKNGGGSNTGLIAGLTTGLVGAALIALVAGLLIYRKRKRAQMIGINKRPVSLEGSPATPHTEIVMTAPTSSKNNIVPPISTPAPVPSTTSTTDHYQDESLYIGSPLFIPPLSATTSAISKPPTNGTNGTTIQRSLTLSARPQYDPSKTLAVNNIGITNNNNLAVSSSLNRSSSVKVTKYDYNPPMLDDDDLDHVQIRRAISVKRRNAAAHSAYLTPHHQPLKSVSRSTSLRSQHTNNPVADDGSNSTKDLLPATATAAAMATTMATASASDKNPGINTRDDNNDDDDDNDSLDEATSNHANNDAIQVVCAKPTIARIRSISRKNSSGKKTTKVVEEDHDQHSHPQATTTTETTATFQHDPATLHSTPSSSSPPPPLPHQPKPLERMSMRSMPDSTHSSTLADGEITVYWQPPSN